MSVFTISYDCLKFNVYMSDKSFGQPPEPSANHVRLIYTRFKPFYRNSITKDHFYWQKLMREKYSKLSLHAECSLARNGFNRDEDVSGKNPHRVVSKSACNWHAIFRAGTLRSWYSRTAYSHAYARRRAFDTRGENNLSASLQCANCTTWFWWYRAKFLYSHAGQLGSGDT